jgi:hypothetical protein
MEIAGSRDFVSVTLPGAKSAEPLRFHVDTGGNTPGLNLRRSVAERLGFASAEALPRSIRVGDRDIALPDGASWFLVDDRYSAFEQATRKDFSVGQLGAGFLSRFLVCIDPGHGRLGIADPAHFALDPAGAKWVPLLLLPGGRNHALYPFAHVLLRDQGRLSGGYGLLLDTGATTSMLDRDKIEYQHQKHPEWPYANGAFGDLDMIGGQWAEQVLRAPDVVLHTAGNPADYGLAERVSIDVGPATFVDRPTGTWSRLLGDVKVTMGSHGAIANDVLLHYRLVLDYAHARLFVDPVDRPVDASASSSRVGLAVRFDPAGCPEVRQITDTNAADTRGKLQIADVILAIDGRDACRMYQHEIAAALAGAAGTTKKVHLRRGGAEMDLDVTTAELMPAPGRPRDQ